MLADRPYMHDRHRYQRGEIGELEPIRSTPRRRAPGRFLMWSLAFWFLVIAGVATAATIWPVQLPNSCMMRGWLVECPMGTR